MAQSKQWKASEEHQLLGIPIITHYDTAEPGDGSVKIALFRHIPLYTYLDIRDEK